MKAKPLERADARRLRSEGMPYKRIAKILGVSPASAFAWTSDIVLTPEQIAANLRGPRGPQNAEAQRQRAAAWSRRCRGRRIEYQQEGRARTRTRDPLHVACCMLYWAEGKKG